MSRVDEGVGSREGTPVDAPTRGRAVPDGDERLRPRQSRLLLALVALLVAVLAASFVLIGGPRQAERCPAAREQSAAGGGTSARSRCPPGRLRRSTCATTCGQPVTLAEYRGKAVLVTFLYTNCPDICPLITSNLRVALNLLGARAAQVQIIAVSVDPRGDTPASVADFLRAHEMLGSMQYLIGSAARTRAHVGGLGASAPRARSGQTQTSSAHSALVYGVSASGEC